MSWALPQFRAAIILWERPQRAHSVGAPKVNGTTRDGGGVLDRTQELITLPGKSPLTPPAPSEEKDQTLANRLDERIGVRGKTLRGVVLPGSRT